MIVPKGFELTPPQINANDDNDNEGGLIDDDTTMVKEIIAIDYYDDDDLDSWGWNYANNITTNM